MAEQVTRDTHLREMLHRAARWFPRQEAVVDPLHRYDYQELLDKVQAMARLLHDQGVRKGDRVALLLYPSVQHVVALLGAWELGAIPCALHLRESPAVLQAVLERLSPRVLVYDGALAPLADRLRAAVALITGAIRAISEETPPEAIDESPDPVIPRDLAGLTMNFEPMAIRPEDTAAIVLSSGTTGIPKGIMHTHRTLIESARGGAYVWQVTPHSCIVNLSTTAFIGWYNLTLPFLNAAAKVVFLSRWDPRRFLETLAREGATAGFLVPTMWRMLLREPLGEYDLSSLRMVGYAGEAMDTSTMAAVRERICANIMNIYGTTESGSCAAGTIMFTEDYADPTKMASVGKPFINADVRVIEPGGSVDDELPAGEEGEVVIRGPSVASEVWDQPEVARRIFEGPWWHSGDMGMIDQDRYLYLRGRIDDMIISGGINILPSEVEEAVLGHDAVVECAVIGLPDEKWGQRVVAFVVCREKVAEEALAAHVADSGLASYKRPREYRHVDELPKGNTGKVSRRLLREQVTDQHAS